MEKRMEKMQLDDDGLVAVMGGYKDRVITMIVIQFNSDTNSKSACEVNNKSM